jgi:ribosomal protein L29
MKPGEMRDLSLNELQTKAEDLRGEAFNIRIKRSTGQLEIMREKREATK